MTMNDMIERLTKDVIENVISEHFTEYEYARQTNPEGVQREMEVFLGLVNESEKLRGSILGLVDLIGNKDCYSDEEKVLFIARQFFFWGWHARGATEDAGRLEDLMK